MPSVQELLAWPVAIYLVSVVLGQVLLGAYRRHAEAATMQRRQRAGLDDKILVDHAVTLAAIRRWSSVDAIVLVLTVVIVPIVLAAFLPDSRAALGATFLALFLWVLISATDLAKSFLGGVAFRAYVGLRRPFQIGDRVTLMGYAGKVVGIDAFFVRLVTADDDLVHIPTAALWTAPLVSANAGDRASLVVMTFHLAPFVSAWQRKEVEDAIWNSIQRSVYWDFDRPIQILLEQQADEIRLTAKAYVALTYNEPLFRSDVYQGFLDYVDAEKVPLASTEWRREI